MFMVPSLTEISAFLYLLSTQICLNIIERTKRAIHGTMMDLENFLTFTMETGEEFEGGWLPTLDTKLVVEKNNSVLCTVHPL